MLMSGVGVDVDIDAVNNAPTDIEEQINIAGY